MGRVSELSAKMKSGELTVQPLSAASGQGRAERMRQQLLQEGKQSRQTVRPVAEKPSASASAPSLTKGKRETSAAALNRAPVQRWENQVRQAQVDLDTDVILRLNQKLKEERARQGKQTLGDRVSDVASAVFGGSGSSFANLAGFASNLVQDPEHNRRQIARLRDSLSTSRTTDGRPISDAQRRTIQESISRLEASAEKWEAPDSFTNRVYQAADRMADTGAAFQESAKAGLGKVGSTIVDAATSMGQSTLDAALGAATGTGMLPFVARSVGGGTQEARRGGAGLDEQLLYGSAQAAKEYVTEKLFGLSAPQRLIGGGSFDDAIEKGIRKATERLAKTPGGQKIVGGLMTWLAGGATEGLEEGIGSVIENALINPNLRDWDPDKRTVEEKISDGLYDMLVGGVSGLMGVTNLAQYQVSPEVRAQYAANRAEMAQGARRTVEQGVDTPQGRNAAEAAQTASGDILMEAARRGGRLDAEPDMAKELDRFLLKDSTGKEKIASQVGEADLSLVERVRKALPQIRDMVPVTELTGTEIPAEGKIVDRLVQFINTIGGKVNRPGFGDVLFSRGRIKSATVGHGVGQGKIDTFAAVPAVIQRGAQIDQQKNWKGRNYDTYTFAAPVTYQGQRTVLGVVVTKDTQSSRYYVHEVVDADGNLLFKNNEIPASASDGTSALSGDLDTVADTGKFGKSPATVDATQMSPNQTPKTSSRLTPSDFTIQQTEPSVKPGIMEQELRRLFGGGKRLSPDTLTAEQLSAVEAANNQGTVDMDAENRLYQVNPEEHIDRRDIQSAGDKRVRAFQFDHPQLHPYYVRAAEALAAELEHYIPGGETASRVSEDGNAYSYRMGRAATPRVAALIDRYGVKPSQIGRAIEAILQDRGQENFAAAKRLELLLDDMLSGGYQDIATGETFGPNREYLELKGQIAGAVDTQQGVGHGLDGIGAADAGSLNSDYDRLQAQSDTFHPEGANAARPVDVPTRDFEGRNISKAASTILGAEILDDADVARLEQMVADGGFSFDTIRDKDALGRAQDTLKAVGFDRALERYIQAAQSNTATKDNTVLGQVLMLEAARGGNRRALAEIASLYARNSTNIGQAMQAQKILRQLGPADRLYALQKSVNELAEKYNVDIELDQAALEAFMNAETEEARQTAEARLIQSAAEQLPTSFRAKYDAVRYLAMLGNPRTHIRNIVGNAAFQIPAIAKNRVGALAELGAQALGADVERTKSLTGANPFGALAKEARADWANAKEFLEGGKYSEGKTTAKDIEREVKPFQNSNPVGKFVGWAADKNGAFLEAEDNLFKQWIYSQSLAGYLKANGVKSMSEASPELLNRARNYAAQEALRNTFNDRNDFSDFIAKAGGLRNSKYRTGRALSYGVEGLLPFKRTPANVLARAVEYSPVGPFLDIRNIFRDAKAGKLDQETVLKHLDRQAAGLSGTALMVLGFLASGMITGGGDEDENQRKFDDLTGHQTYAIETKGGKSVTLDWLAPSAIPFFMGVELAHSWQDGGLSWDDALKALRTMTEPMLEMSMLQGLNDFAEDIGYAQQHGEIGIAAGIASAASSYLTQVFPTLFGQMERISEDKRMTTYSDENSKVPKDLQFFMGKLSQKVPGWDYQQIPYLDAWGREEDTGDPVERVFNNLINPAYVSQVTVDSVEQELQRVADATGNTSVFPDRAPRYFTVEKERKNLTAEEYQTYARKRGKLGAETLKQMMDSPGYQRLSDEKKAEAIKDVYQYADSLAKMEVSGYRPGKGTVAAGVLNSMLPPSGYILYQLNRDRDGDGKVSKMESTQTLLEVPGLNDKQRGKAWSAFNDSKTAEVRNPFTGALSKEGLGPEEAQAAWDIYGRSGTKAEPYTQERKKQDLQEELDLTAAEVRRVWELMEKAAEMG